MGYKEALSSLQESVDRLPGRGNTVTLPWGFFIAVSTLSAGVQVLRLLGISLLTPLHSWPPTTSRWGSRPSLQLPASGLRQASSSPASLGTEQVYPSWPSL